MARTGAEALRHLGVKQTIGGVHFCDAPKTRRLKSRETASTCFYRWKDYRIDSISTLQTVLQRLWQVFSRAK